MKILFVEDDTGQLHVWSKVFEKMGYEVAVAENGADALELFRNQNINIIVTDINMPKMNGMELSKSIRKTNSMVPIIMVTGNEEHTRTANPQEFNASLVKPASVRRLQQEIENCTRPIYLGYFS
ncbi:MAG: response regulator [Zetaproteobacteria bacterium]|nr:response regulator [Zetaproteobacteria bacterium]